MADTETAPAPAALRRGGGFDLVLAAGCVIVAGQLVLRGELLRRSFFIHDDYVHIARAAAHGLDFSYLFQNYNGQFMPLGLAVTWVLTRIGPYDWGNAMAVILALQAGAGLALLRALRVLFGSRWLVLAPLTLYALTPMTMPTLGWYTAALSSLPLQAALAMAVAAHVRYVRAHAAGETGGRDRHLIETLVWVTVGMLAGPKAAVIVPLLFALTSAYVFTGTWGAAARAAWLRYPRMWWWLLRTLAVLIVLYALSWMGAGTRQDLRGMDGDQMVGFAGRLLGQTFPLYFLGGPWRWVAGGENYGTPHPANAQIALGVLVVAAVVGISLRYRRVAYRAWVILLGYLLVADVAPVVFGRVPRFGGFLGVESRYVTDAAPVLAICLTLAFVALSAVGGADNPTTENQPYVRPLPAGALLPGLAGLAAGAVAIASVWCLNAYRDRLGGTHGRTFLANARRELARGPDLRQVFPTFVPAQMMDSGFGAARMTPSVLAPVLTPAQRDALGHPRPTQHPLVFDPSGRLHRGAVFGTTGTPPPDGSGCWKLSTAVPRQITLAKRLRTADYVVAVGYLATRSSPIEVRFGSGKVARAVFRATPKYGRFTFAVHGGGPILYTTKLTEPGRVCVTDVSVGYAVPANG